MAGVHGGACLFFLTLPVFLSTPPSYTELTLDYHVVALRVLYAKILIQPEFCNHAAGRRHILLQMSYASSLLDVGKRDIR